MIKDYECFYCFAKSFGKLIESQNLSKSQKAEFSQYLAHLEAQNTEYSTPEFSAKLHRKLEQLSGNKDVYAKEKADSNQKATQLANKWLPKIQSSDNPFDLTLRLAIAGNIMDYGVSDSFDIDKNIEYVLNTEFAIDQSEALQKEIMQAKQILYLGDNAGEIVLDIQGLTVPRDNGTTGVDDFSITIHEGEIVGLAGVSGNGQPELFDSCVGVKTPKNGKILLAGEDITGLSPLEISESGLASVPQDRLKQGLISEFSVQENLILGIHGNEPFSKYSIINWAKVKTHSRDAIENFEIATRGPDQKVKQLSGGNLQKLIIGREMERDCDLYVFVYPTRGLDVGATEFVRNAILQLRNQGKAVIMVSGDFDEIFSLSDKIAVMYEGKFTGIFNNGDHSLEEIGLMMSGCTEEQAVKEMSNV